MRYFTNALSFDCPAGLHDRTHHILTVTEDGPSPFTIVVSRNRVDSAETLAEVVDRVVGELPRALEAFHLLSRGPGIVARQEAELLEFRWQQAGQALFQRQAALILDGAEGRHLIQVAATASDAAPAEDMAMLDTVLASMALRGQDPV